MIVEFKFPPVSGCIDVSRIKLTQVEREPIEDIQDVSFQANAKAGNVLVDCNQITVFGYSVS